LNENNKSFYLSGINGLRAIAALSVVAAHVMMPGISNFNLKYRLDLPMAGYGVTLFFVISGFLITFLLLKEIDKTGNISIRKFYFRRILRIWPIYYLFIIICVILSFFISDIKIIKANTIICYLFFAANVPFIFGNGILIIAHYWSIGVEEQFYLFWPWVVKLSQKKLLIYSFLIFFILFSIKCILWLILGSKSLFYQAIMVTRFHCMMVGAIGAILYVKSNLFFIKLSSDKVVQLSAWVLFICMGIGIIRLPAPIASEFIALVSLVLIIGQITKFNRLINLDHRFFDFIGKISYGIYIIHPLVIYLSSSIFIHLEIYMPLKYILVYAWVFFVTIAVSYFSYTYFESKFLRLKQKFTVISSVSSRY
jgi:peptidoglycan/LPS O-acetylase OafA/YrhL